MVALPERLMLLPKAVLLADVWPSKSNVVPADRVIVPPLPKTVVEEAPALPIKMPAVNAVPPVQLLLSLASVIDVPDTVNKIPEPETMELTVTVPLNVAPAESTTPTAEPTTDVVLAPDNVPVSAIPFVPVPMPAKVIPLAICNVPLAPTDAAPAVALAPRALALLAINVPAETVVVPV